MSDRQKSRLCWVGFGVILLHNLEEAFTAPAWLAAHARELQLRFGLERIPAANARGFYASLTVLTILILFWIVAVRRAPDRSLGMHSLVFLFAVFFCNALVPHLAGALLLGRYVPGVLTAVLLVMPFTIVWSIRAFRAGWVDAKGFTAGVAAAIVFYTAVAGSLLGMS